MNFSKENFPKQNLPKEIILSALFTAIAVILSPLFVLPLGVTKAFPLQHMVNIFLAVLCGTRYGVMGAFSSSLLRNLLGTGTILAFPGSLFGAFLSGYLYERTGKLWAAVVGEFVGTSLIGGLVSYPLAALLLGSEKGAFFYVTVFSVSCGAGCVMAYFLLQSIHLIQTKLKQE